MTVTLRIDATTLDAALLALYETEQASITRGHDAQLLGTKTADYWLGEADRFHAAHMALLRGIQAPEQVPA